VKAMRCRQEIAVWQSDSSGALGQVKLLRPSDRASVHDSDDSRIDVTEDHSNLPVPRYRVKQSRSFEMESRGRS